MPSLTPKRLWQALKTVFATAAAPVPETLDPELEAWLDDAAARQANEIIDDYFESAAAPEAPDNEDDGPADDEESERPEREEILGVDDQGRPHREDGPARIVHHAGNTNEVQERTGFYMRHGDVVARAEFLRVADMEGSLYREQWFDAAGLRHRDGAAAVIVRSNHAIPEETHLDEAREEFWTHGVKTNEIDRTYKDIVAYKPLVVRQAFGWDV